MKSWPGPRVPRLPGRGRPLRLYDSATGEVRPTAPGATARMYVCGITPYDATHLGHAATYLAFDLVQRVWRDAGHDVALRAERHRRRRPAARTGRADGEDWRDLAERETDLFRDRHDRAAGAAAGPLRRRGRGDPARSCRADRGGCSTRAPPTTSTTTSTSPSAPRRRFGYESRLRRGGDAHAVRRARRRPGPAGQEGPARPAAVAGGAAGRAVLGLASSDPGRPGWHVECAAIALDRLGHGVRRAGRRHRPALPAPRDVARPRRGR